MALRRGTLWLGLAGFDSEGEFHRGGLVAMDSVTGRARWVLHARLDRATVNAIAVDSAGMWLAVSTPGEYGDGNGGLLRYEPERASPAARWTFVSARQGHIADDVVFDVVTEHGLTVVVTRTGLAVRTSDGAWDRRFYRLRAAGDSIVTELETNGPDEFSNDSVLRLLAVRALNSPNAAKIVAGLQRVNTQSYDWSYGLHGDSGAALLVKANVLPALLDAVRRAPARVANVVYTAIGMSGDPLGVAALRPILARQTDTAEDSSRVAEIAVALARLSDPRGIQWVLENFDRQLNSDAIVEAARLAARSGDMMALRRIAIVLSTRRVLPFDSPDQQAVTSETLSPTIAVDLVKTLFAFTGEAPWTSLGFALSKNPSLRASILMASDSVEASSQAGAQFLLRETLTALSVDDSSTAVAARKASVLARDPRTVQALVRLIQRGAPAYVYANAVACLVSLTGQSSAPYIASIPDANTAPRAGKFWVDWLIRQSGHIPLVSYAEGMQAATTWYLAGTSASLAPRPTRRSGSRRP